MEVTSRPAPYKILLAFAVIYFVWGSTYLAIRVGVAEIPPLLFAGMRFLVAGLLVYGWMMARGERSPNLRQWGSVVLLAMLIFVCDYGLLFWAEQRVPSGLAAVMMATIPVFIALAEIVILRTQRLTVRLALALVVGVVGVVVLVSRSLHLGGATVSGLAAAGLMFASLSWAIATVITRRLPLPASKGVSSGAQMLAGGVMLMVVSGAIGEFGRFHPAAVPGKAWWALVYLIFAGSILGFTAYVWLIHHESPTKVGTYAYVNPVVAVIVGYFLGGEGLGMRTVVGTICVLISVVLITTMKKKPAGKLRVEAS
jgi:drug/metabolite transporter (DMT)-like permease